MGNGGYFIKLEGSTKVEAGDIIGLVYSPIGGLLDRIFRFSLERQDKTDPSDL